MKRRLQYVLAGAILSLMLHAYFVAAWDRYVSTIPPTRIAQLGGSVPDAHLASSTASARDGAMALFVGGLLCGIAAGRFWRDSASFIASAAAVQLVAAGILGLISGNLWPLAVISILVLVIIPAAAGASLGALRKPPATQNGDVPSHP
jgi:hypothetical protein